MAKQQNVRGGMVASKGYWQTPWQQYTASRDIWNKITKEDIDLEEFKKKKLITYFNHESDVIYQNDYDRFHPKDDFDPNVKVQAIRDRIAQEEEERTIPAVVSHQYGHRYTNLEGKTWISHKRIDVMTEIYRRHHPNLKPDKKLPRSIQMEKL